MACGWKEQKHGREATDLNPRHLRLEIPVELVRYKILSSHLRKQAQSKAGTRPRMHTLLSAKLGLESQTLSGPFCQTGINSFIGYHEKPGVGQTS